MTQTGGRLPRAPGEYYDYPFIETLHYGCVAVFKLQRSLIGELNEPGQPKGIYLKSFTKDPNSLVFMSPIKRERENSGRIKLKAGEQYIVVCTAENPGTRSSFHLSCYFDQRLRDVEIKRVFHPNDKNSKNEPVLPQLIPEENEKSMNTVPLWKIQLVKESLRFMMTDEDTGVQDQQD